jgi:hypothetical protein
MHDVYSLTLPWKIRETINYNHLMSEHVFSTSALKLPLRLDENSLSTAALKSFNELLTNDPCSLNSVLHKNGFIVDSANGM